MHTARLLTVSPSMHCARGGGCLLWGVCSWGCLLPGGGGGGGISACTDADTPPPVNRILDTRYWKYYLAGGKYYIAVTPQMLFNAIVCNLEIVDRLSNVISVISIIFQEQNWKNWDLVCTRETLILASFLSAFWQTDEEGRITAKGYRFN